MSPAANSTSRRLRPPLVLVDRRIESQGATWSGESVTDLRLRPLTVTRSTGREIHRATIGADLGQANAPGRCERWADLLRPWDRVQIVHLDPAGEWPLREVLFAGLVRDPVLSLAGSPVPAGSSESLAWVADGYLALLFNLADCQCQGTRYYSRDDQLRIDAGELVDGDTVDVVPGFAGGVPLVFNAAGKPDRHPVTTRFTTWAGETVDVPRFCDPTLAGATAWTLGGLLDYLVGWHWPDGKLARPVFTDAQREAIDAATIGEIRGEGLSAGELLDVACRAAGWRFAEEWVVDEESGNLTPRLRLWQRGTGAAVDLRLQAAGATLSADDNVARAVVQYMHGGVVNRPTVVGATRRQELRIPLMPGWRDIDLSTALVPGDLDYNQRHVVGGDDYADYHQVGRLWVANEDGFYSASSIDPEEGEEVLYDRGDPWDAAGACGEEAGSWSLRRRKPLPLLTTDPASGQSLGYRLVVTADATEGSPTYWVLADGDGFTPLADRLGVLLTVGELSASWGRRGGLPITPDLEITDEGWVDPVDLWQMIVDAKTAGDTGDAWDQWDLRLWLICTIERDDVMTFSAAPTPNSASPLVLGRIYRRPNLREDTLLELTIGGLALPGGDAPGSRNDAGKIIDLANQIRDVTEDRTVTVAAGDDRIVTEYGLGDVVERIAGRDIELKRNAGQARQLPELVKITWTWGAQGAGTEWSFDSSAHALRV